MVRGTQDEAAVHELAHAWWESRRTRQRDALMEVLRQLGTHPPQGFPRIAELAKEDTKEVLGLEGGDRWFDAVAGHVADDRGDAVRRDAEHVVEIPSHEASPRLVDTTDVETGKVGEVVGRQSLRPSSRRQLLLRQHLLSTALEHGPVLEQP